MGISSNKTMRQSEIGEWSEVKLDIVGKYASAYSRILDKQPFLKHYYIDGFCGYGSHVSKVSGVEVPGSPIRALEVEPPFERHYFIDLDGKKTSALQEVCDRDFPNRDIRIFKGECNPVLMGRILPNMSYRKYERALCLLDPYGLDYEWETVEKMGQMGIVDLFLNFPIMDMNRNVLWAEPERTPADQIARMNKFWGDDSWREVAYRPSSQLSLDFTALGDGTQPALVKEAYGKVADAYVRRLRDKAGFKHTVKPVLMRIPENKAPLYYLMFASGNEQGAKIANDIFKKHRG